ncbi:MAG: serine/threonine protein kinase [Myxococcales bacterium]|nr:serine/threonine protein kinase [Myxococcales bacterium]
MADSHDQIKLASGEQVAPTAGPRRRAAGDALTRTIDPRRLALEGTLAAPAPRKAAPAPSLPVISIGGPDGAGAHGEELAVTRTLGEGGMARVDEAWQRSLERRVAIKRVRPDRWSEAADQDLLHEARIVGALEHPNIIPVHAFGVDRGGQSVLVMKCVEGVSWRALMEQPEHPVWQGRTDEPLGRHLEILQQVCNAVQFAHGQGVIHRDLKTDNVMIGACGEVYVVDWGIAVKLDERGQAPAPDLAGTPAFMAPEMVRPGHCLTVRTDVYLLGGILHEILTGGSRHDGVTLEEVLQQARESRPCEHDPSVPEELAAICRRATQVDPAARYPDVPAFREAIAGFLRHRGSTLLGEEGARRLVELRALLDAPPGAAPGAAVDPRNLVVRRLAAECRFACDQALRAWRDNVAAARTARDCGRAMIDFELSAGNVAAAESLLSELAAPEPVLVEQVRVARARSDADRGGAGRLAVLLQDADLQAEEAMRLRTYLIGSVVMTLTVAVILFLGRTGRMEVQALHVIAVIGLPMVPLTIVALRSWRTLRDRRVNRKLVFAWLALIVAELVEAIVCARLHVPVGALLATIALISGLGAVLFGLFLDTRRLLPVVAAIALVPLGALVWPDRVLEGMTFAMVVATAAYLRAWRRAVGELASRESVRRSRSSPKIET